MLLAIDVGNTSTKFGLFDDKTLFRKITAPTVRSNTAKDIYSYVSSTAVDAVIISSVVPELNDSYLKFSQKYYNLAPFFVDNSFDFSLKINYHPAENLGVDRLIAAFAAAEKYGAPCIVCDFGTATTIDAVNSEREFLGGIIAPGMNLLAEALALKTSKLPHIEIKKPQKVIGNTTVKAIQSGIYFGYVGLVEGILERMIEELGECKKPQIIATGGFAPLIAKSSNSIETIDETLMLDGLDLLYRRISQK